MFWPESVHNATKQPVELTVNFQHHREKKGKELFQGPFLLHTWLDLQKRFTEKKMELKSKLEKIELIQISDKFLYPIRIAVLVFPLCTYKLSALTRI